MKHAWPHGTTVSTGDSILNNLEEYRLNKRFNVKVRPFPEADVDDMYQYILPDNIILYIGTNDTPDKTSTEILNEIAELKLYIESILPHVNIYLSYPVLRTDNAKAGFTIHHLRQKMKALFVNVIGNDNIAGSCLGNTGLHLNLKGAGRLAINFLSQMRRL